MHQTLCALALVAGAVAAAPIARLQVLQADEDAFLLRDPIDGRQQHWAVHGSDLVLTADDLGGDSPAVLTLSRR